jgi:hypothetical protein
MIVFLILCQQPRNEFCRHTFHIQIPFTDGCVRWFCYMIDSKTVSSCLSSGFWYQNKWGRRILPCNVEKSVSW